MQLINKNSVVRYNITVKGFLSKPIMPCRFVVTFGRRSVAEGVSQ